MFIKFTMEIQFFFLQCLNAWKYIRISEYRKQWNEARKYGMKSAIRRKIKRLKTLEELLKKAKKGENIDISNIPNPFFSPPKTQVSNIVYEGVLYYSI
jgi:hypothetical protein